MNVDYDDISKKLKAISDPKRLKIVNMLSCGELCACEILEKFDISQPTLSHDMKRLMDADIVTSKRVGKNTYYSLNTHALDYMGLSLDHIFSDQEDCICKLCKVDY